MTRHRYRYALLIGIITALALAIIVYYMLELKRQLEETREHVETLHNDVRDEIYQRYGERFDGKK